MKRYKCLECGLKQKIKSEMITLKPRDNHMTDSIHGRCAKCKKTTPMTPLSKD